MVADDGYEFGEVERAPHIAPPLLDEEVIRREILVHLDEQAQNEVWGVFRKHCAFLDGKPGLAKVGRHRIEIKH